MSENPNSDSDEEYDLNFISMAAVRLQGILRKGASSPSLSMKLKGEKSKQSNDNLLDDASSAISNKKRKLETRFGFLKVK